MLPAPARPRATTRTRHSPRLLASQRERDDESALMHYRARSYDPRTGRFIQREPKFSGRVSGQYLYVRNAPTSATDPSGLKLIVDGKELTEQSASYESFTRVTGFQFQRPGVDTHARPIWKETVDTMIQSAHTYKRTGVQLELELQVRDAVVTAMLATLKNPKDRFGRLVDLVDEKLLAETCRPTWDAGPDVAMVEAGPALRAFALNPQNFKFDCVGAASSALAYGQTVGRTDANLAALLTINGTKATFGGLASLGDPATPGFIFRITQVPELPGEYLPGDLVGFSSQTALDRQRPNDPWIQEWTIYTGKQGGTGERRYAAFPLFDKPESERNITDEYNRQAKVNDAKKMTGGLGHRAPNLAR